MGDRKELNKYIPPNFDPKKIPRVRKPKNQQKKVRTMLPLRIRCNTCGSYISEGTKFNSRGEQVIDETYLGLKIHRFYIKCTNCCAELIFKTDLQNSSYAVESGATCIYDQHKQEAQAEESVVAAMTSLEKSTSVSKREIDVIAALDELQSMKARRMSVSVDYILEALSRKEEEEAKEEDAALIKSIRFGKQRLIAEEETIEKKRRMEAIDKKKPKTTKRLACGKSPVQLSSACIITSKKKKTTSLGLASLCHNYGADEED